MDEELGRERTEMAQGPKLLVEYEWKGRRECGLRNV
jgi:hypothetical protein